MFRHFLVSLSVIVFQLEVLASVYIRSMSDRGATVVTIVFGRPRGSKFLIDKGQFNLSYHKTRPELRICERTRMHTLS